MNNARIILNMEEHNNKILDVLRAALYYKLRKSYEQ